MRKRGPTKHKYLQETLIFFGFISNKTSETSQLFGSMFICSLTVSPWVLNCSSLFKANQSRKIELKNFFHKNKGILSRFDLC